jgi:cyclic lactone autoinducer peptide
MKKLLPKVFLFSVSLLLFLANITSSSTCAICHYQPEVPESLRK